MKSEQLLFHIGDIDPKYVEMAESKVKSIAKETKIISMHRYIAPFTACLTIVIILIIIVNRVGWYNPVHTSELIGGTLNFYKSGNILQDSFDFGVEVTSRELTDDENRLLFGDLSIKSMGIFNSYDQTLIHIEGVSDNTKVIMSYSELTSDWIVSGIEETSEINGVQVLAGYLITSENSQGIKNIVYYASFELNDVHVYVECGGDEKSDAIWKSEITSTVDILTQNSMLSLLSIAY